MAAITSSKRVRAQDLQNLDLTVDYWDDGTTTVRTNGSGGGTAALASNQAIAAAASRGELAGSVTAVQLPSVAGTHVLVKARWNNTGNVYIGGSGVTRPDGTTDTTTGAEMAPGDQKLYSLVANLNELYRICDNAGDALTYEVW